VADFLPGADSLFAELDAAFALPPSHPASQPVGRGDCAILARLFFTLLTLLLSSMHIGQACLCKLCVTLLSFELQIIAWRQMVGLF
jgi:hypothetical protein